MVSAMASTKKVKRDGLFNVPRLEAMIQEHLDDRADRSDQLWRVLNFPLWQRALPESAAAPARERQGALLAQGNRI